MRKTLLIPALLDHHWPLLRWAFETKGRRVVVLEAQKGIEDAGLRAVHNDLCYPFVLISGQVLLALRSGKYAPAETSVLIAQAGDACRGSCLIRLLRPVLDQAGFAQVELVSLNVRGIERSAALPVNPAMARRALAALCWGDTLMLLENQTRPYESHPGETDALVQAWTKTLSEDLQTGRSLSSRAILRRCREMAEGFRAVNRVERPVQKVAVVGDIYTKYCSLGNWNLEAWLAHRGCEAAVNGFSWHLLYYLDTHLDTGPLPLRLAGQAALAWGAGLQRRLVGILRQAGFKTLPPYRELKKLAAEYSGSGCSVGSGWLLAGEAAAWVRAGYPKVVATLPFGCLPGHIYGRGQYAALQRRLPGSLITGVDYDAALRPGTVETRLRMLLDAELPNGR